MLCAVEGARHLDAELPNSATRTLYPLVSLRKENGAVVMGWNDLSGINTILYICRTEQYFPHEPREQYLYARVAVSAYLAGVADYSLTKDR